MIKNRKVEFVVKVALKTLLIVFGIIGLYTTMSGGGFMGSGSAMLYFTIQSNITIMLAAAVFLAEDILKFTAGRSFVKNWMIIVKFAFTVAITLTFLVFFVLLAPTLSISYLFSMQNFAVHLLVPTFAIADFVMFDYNIKLKKYTFLFGAAMPFYYMFFALICSASGVMFGDCHVPYFFLDYIKFGWFSFENGMGVMYWIVILVFVVCAISFLYVYIAKVVQRSVERKKDCSAPNDSQI